MFLRVIPDIPKLEKSYWYICDNQTNGSSSIKIGSIVRINIHGRRVRAWVVELAQTNEEFEGKVSEPIELSKLKSVIEYVSDGPPPHLVDFSTYLSEHYLVSPVGFLRACSPTRIVKGVDYKNHAHSETKEQKVVFVNPRADRRQIIQDNISSDGSTLIVSPDSHNRIYEWLKQIRNNAILYSSENKTAEERYKKATNNNSVILGGRACLFAPATDVKSIIVLDDAYEQQSEERSPKWNALDVAKLMSNKWGANLVVVTSVPSSSTYGLTEVDLRASESNWPIIVIDNKNEIDPVLGAFSPKIVSAISNSLDAGFDAAIIINNKVSSRFLVCKSCDEIATCASCGHAVHEDSTLENPFVCPICKESRPIICLTCSSTKFKKYRRGLQSIADECKGLFSKHEVLEFSKGKIAVSLEKREKQRLYVSTEALFHRSDLLEKLGCCVLIDIDSNLFRPSMIAFEQTLVLANRAIRALKKTELKNPVVISTKAPNNELVLDLLKGEFVKNRDRDLELRKKLNLAPFFATAEIKASTNSIDTFLREIPGEIVKGKTLDGENSTVFLVAENHKKLSEYAYIPVRTLASKGRCTISIDTYD